MMQPFERCPIWVCDRLTAGDAIDNDNQARGGTRPNFLARAELMGFKLGSGITWASEKFASSLLGSKTYSDSPEKKTKWHTQLKDW